MLSWFSQASEVTRLQRTVVSLGEQNLEHLEDGPCRATVPYPVAVDKRRMTWDAYEGKSYPDYFLIDRKGVLLSADLEATAISDAPVLLLKKRWNRSHAPDDLRYCEGGIPVRRLKTTAMRSGS